MAGASHVNFQALTMPPEVHLRCRAYLELGPAALFVLLAAAARARIVAASLGFFAPEWLVFQGAGVQEAPVAVLFLEQRLFPVLLAFALSGELGAEADNPFLVVRFAGLALHDFEPMPLGLLGPLLDFLALHFGAGLRVMRADDVVDIASGERGIASPQELLGRRGLALSLDEGQATGFKRGG